MDWTVEKLLETIEQAAFTRTDIQSLVDSLLAESADDSWHTKVGYWPPEWHPCVVPAFVLSLLHSLSYHFDPESQPLETVPMGCLSFSVVLLSPMSLSLIGNTGL